MRGGRLSRAFVGLAGVALLLAATGSALAAQEQGLRIRNVDAEEFPRMSVTIAFDEPTRLAAGDLEVIEDGVTASGIAVRPLVEAGGPVDVVLALDVSGSMRGEPMEAAVAAAEEFVRGLPPDARVGVVAFANEPVVVQPLTSNRRAVLRVLNSLTVGGETALYDAVVTAAEMFSGAAQRNIVLLSDGGNTVGDASLAAAVRAAREAEAAVFSVGLRTPETDVSALRALAARSGGTYAPARAADLGSIFEGLAAELANQFLVTYRSSIEGGREFTLTVSALGVRDSALVFAPASAPSSPRTSPAPAPPAPATAPRPIFGGVVGLTAALTLTFLGAFTISVMAIGTTSQRRRDRTLAKRIRVTPGSREREPAPEPERPRGTWLPGPVAALGDHLAGSGRFARTLDRRLEQAGLPLRAGEFLMLQLFAALLGAAFGALIQGALFVALFAIVAALAPRAFLAYAIRRRRNQLHEQLPDVLMLLSSSLRAGHSFLQALDLVAKEIGDPGAQEFGRVVAEIRLGRPVEEALNDMAERVDSDDFRWAVMAVNIQREVGGNLAEVLDTVAETVRDRQTVRRQVQVLSAEGRLSAAILTALPFLIVLYIARVNPGYLATLFSHQLGIVMVVMGSVLMLGGIVWMRRMVKIDV